MKRLISGFIVLLLAFVLVVMIGGVRVNAWDGVFHLITTNPGEDASTTISINYHIQTTGSHIEYTVEEDSEFKNAQIVMPEERLWSIQGQKNADEKDTFYTNPRYVCSATLTNLTPCTKYIYRLVQGNEVSAIYHFTTAGLTNNWNFMAFADFQYGKNKVSHNMIRKMQELGGNPPLAVGIGDMTDYGGREEEVTWFLDNSVMRDFIFASAPGDHEYWARDISGSKLFTTPYVYNATFNNPKNGAADTINSNFYFYYNNVLFVMIDTDDSDTVSSTRMTKEVNWFKTTIKSLEGTYQYLVVLGHKSIYSAYDNDSRVFTTIRPQWFPVFDECGVDLVISGHDHMYSRTYKLYNGSVITNRGEDRYKGTYYLDLGSSGDKTRASEPALQTDGLHECVLDNHNNKWVLAANVEVSEEEMHVYVYNQLGRVLDEFVVLPKRDPLPIELTGFEKEELFDDVSITIDSFSTGLGTLSFENGKMLKYVKNIKVKSGDVVCLDEKVKFNMPVYQYELKNLSKIKYEIVFTLNDNTEVVKEFNCDYWKSSNIKIKDSDKLYLNWTASISSLSGYTWKLYVDGTLIKDLNTNDLKMGSLSLANDYLIGEHVYKIELMEGSTVVDTYELTYKAAEALVLSSTSIKLNVGSTTNLDYEFDYEDLVKVKVGDSSIIQYENGVITGLKEGKTDITFTIRGTDLSYKCEIEVVKKGGCANASATILNLLTVTAIAFVVRKKKFYE